MQIQCIKICGLVAPSHEGGERDFKDRLKECLDFVAAVAMDVAVAG